MFLRFALTIILLSFNACTNFGFNFKDSARASLNLTKAKTPLLNSSGSFTIVRQVPKPSNKLISPKKQVLAISNNNKKTIVIDRITGTILLSKNDKILRKIENVQGLGNLDGGKFKISSKKRTPLWYASESYYLNRNIPIPEEDSNERYLRGALGEFALYLDNNVVIHNSPLWTQEIGGVKLKEKDLQLLFSQIEVGSNVLVL